MRNCRRKAILGGLAVALCAGAAHSQNPDAVKTAEAACGRLDQHLKVDLEPASNKGTAAAGKAVVYVISSFDRGDLVIGVGVDGEWVGAIEPRSYVAIPMVPGEHHFCVRVQGTKRPSAVGLDGLSVQAGEEYYLLAVNGMFLRKKSANLTLRRVNLDEGRLLVAQRSVEKLGQGAGSIQAAEFACGPATIRYHVDLESGSGSTPLPSGMAIVYFISQEHTPYRGTTLRVGIDGRWIGAVRKKSYTAVTISPGIHHFCVLKQVGNRMKGAALEVLNAKAGGVYYFLSNCFEQFHYWSYGPGMDEVGAGEGKLLIAQSQLAVAQVKSP